MSYNSLSSSPADRCVSWDDISSQGNGILTDQFILKFDRHINFTLLSEHYFMSILLMRIYFHKLSWFSIIKRQKLEESTLWEFADSFDHETWKSLEKYQTLSQQFKYNFENKLHSAYEYDNDEVAPLKNITHNSLKLDGEIKQEILQSVHPYTLNEPPDLKNYSTVDSSPSLTYSKLLIILSIIILIV